MTDYVLEMKSVVQIYQNIVHALKGVDFSVRRGEIHGLVGENGAGKSTLMNILGGVVQRTGGKVLLDGEEINFRTTHEARNHAISFIHQELNLISDLMVYENIFLGEEIRNKYGFLKAEEMVKNTKMLLEKIGVYVNPYQYVRDLDATHKQVVEIAKALRQNSKLIIMDEPTTSLTDPEIQRLYAIMEALRQNGVSIIFISHKLKEILHICDRYTVLRDGLVAGCGDVEGTTEKDIVRLMVGRDFLDHQYYSERNLGEIVMEAKNISVGKSVNNVSFSLRKGEILGFTGLAGDGRTELFEAIYGIRNLESGELLIKNSNCKINHPEKAKANHLGYVPKNRKENAIIADLSIRENITLPSLKNFRKGLFIDEKKEIEKSIEHVDRLQLKYNDLNDLITQLSGGNQQKVVLAKWLEADSEIIIFDNPTQGIDVGATHEIYQLIMKLAEAGKSVIILSSEFAEIMKVCDRIIIMYHGEVSADLPRTEADEETLMMHTMGIHHDAKTIGPGGDR